MKAEYAITHHGNESKGNYSWLFSPIRQHFPLPPNLDGVLMLACLHNYSLLRLIIAVLLSLGEKCIKVQDNTVSDKYNWCCIRYLLEMVTFCKIITKLLKGIWIVYVMIAYFKSLRKCVSHPSLILRMVALAYINHTYIPNTVGDLHAWWVDVSRGIAREDTDDVPCYSK